jgi:fructose-1-phosphate kinase PfkB-like protein
MSSTDPDREARTELYRATQSAKVSKESLLQLLKRKDLPEDIRAEATQLRQLVQIVSERGTVLSMKFEGRDVSFDDLAEELRLKFPSEDSGLGQ